MDDRHVAWFGRRQNRRENSCSAHCFQYHLRPALSAAYSLPPLGVAGAAWGTALAAAATCVIGYIYLLRHNPYINMHGWDYSLDWHIIRDILARIGVPASLQMIVIMLSGVIIISLVNTFGTDVMAFGIGMQVDMLATIPFMSIGMAAISIAGQNLGAHMLETRFETMRNRCISHWPLEFSARLFYPLSLIKLARFFLSNQRQTPESRNLWPIIISGWHLFSFVSRSFPRHPGYPAQRGRHGGAVGSFVYRHVHHPHSSRLSAGPGLSALEQNGIWMAMLSSKQHAGGGLNWLYYKGGRKESDI